MKQSVLVESVKYPSGCLAEIVESSHTPILTKLVTGKRLGEGIYIGAGTKVGKSELISSYAEHVNVQETSKITVFRFDENQYEAHNNGVNKMSCSIISEHTFCKLKGN